MFQTDDISGKEHFELLILELLLFLEDFVRILILPCDSAAMRRNPTPPEDSFPVIPCRITILAVVSESLSL
jgi:hypothetical protein